MKITYFDFLRHIVPNGSCGTGYSEPDEFEVGYETKDEESFKTIYIDIWYRPIDAIKEEFLKTIKRHFGNKVENIEEAFEMYAKQIANETCPYDFKEIMNANKI